MFKEWLKLREVNENKKAVLLLGGPACGKSFIINQFRQRGFAVSSLDDFFEPALDKGQSKIYVSTKDPAMKSLYVNSATKADELIKKYLQEGVSFVTEKTGQFWTTTVELKEMIESYGYKVFCIFIHCDPDLAWKRNLERKRVFQDKDEFMNVHAKAKLNLIPSTKNPDVVGFRNLFGKRFIEINNDGTPENNEIIKTTINRIINS